LKLIYLSLMRFPTEKAHALQITQNCEAFAEHGYTVELWVTGRINTPEMNAISDVYAYYGIKPNFKIQRVPVIDLMSTTSGRLHILAFYLMQFSYLLMMSIMLITRQADIYYTRDESTAWLLSWLKPKKSIAYEAHLFSRTGRRKQLQAQIVKRVGSIIAITPRLKADLVALGAPEHRVMIAHDGIRAERFANLPTRTQARTQLNWSQESYIVGFIGRLSMLNMDKGVGTLIQALKDIPNVQLALVGGPDDIALQYKQEWLKLGLAEQNFLYMGSVPPHEVPKYICGFDVCAMPHPNTTQYANYTSPLKLFEYMACGKAVVASDLPSWADVLQHEKNAWLVPAENTKALYTALHHLQEHPELRENLGLQAQKEALEHYTWQSRTQAILGLIQSAT
jgi:glycosyltransferase involved in cell wall biosynthesis